MRLTILAIVMFTINVFAYSATIKVPRDYTKIQAAINASVNGDTVLVAKGTYAENIDFKGKAITVKSSGGAKVTVIDGGNPINPDYASVVIFQNGEGYKSVLDGFTLTNGSGTYISAYMQFRGGGIYCHDTAPIIMNNIITGNTVDGTAVGYGEGGGICCAAQSYPQIFNNTISGNTAKGYLCCGGGICCYEGGSLGTCENNIICNNEVEAGYYSYGGGIYCDGYCSPVTRYNTIYGNSASYGGGVYCGYSAKLSISNTILWSNSATTGTEICLLGNYSYPATVYLNHSDIKGGRASVHVGSFCNFKWSSTNIDSDPRFINETNNDFHLTYLSPCKDTAVKLYGELTDHEGDPRIAYGLPDMGADEFYTHLYYTGDATPGKDITINLIDVPTSKPVYLWVGSGVFDPPLHSKKFGDWYLQPPLLMGMFLGAIPQPRGVLSHHYRFNPSLPVMDIPMQALIGKRLTNFSVISVR